MKGVFVYQQLEYRVEMSKDDVTQEDVLPCKLTVKNHSGNAQSLPDVTLDLVCGNPKIADPTSANLELVASAEFPLPWQLAPQQEVSGEWCFELDRNSPVSDKGQTLLFRYGAVSTQLQVIPLTVSPHPHIQAVIGYLQSTFQFVVKGVKSSKGWVEVKCKPPTARRFSFVKEMIACFRFDTDALLMKFRFSMKKFEGSDSGVKIGKGKSEYEVQLEQSRYTSLGGYLNQQVIEAAIDEALSTVSTGL